MINILPLTSLPRSGSTLLMNILSQNNSFVIGNDSEIGNILNHNKRFMIDNIHHFQLPQDIASQCFYDFCRAGVNSWISNLCSEEKIFIDKSRHWLIDLDYFFKIFPNMKIIILIRDLRGIVNSFEKIHNNSLFVDKYDLNFYKNFDSDFQFQRIQMIFEYPIVQKGLVGIKELLELPKDFSDKILICRYEDLISNSKLFLDQIYDFLNLPPFDHNVEKINQILYNDNPYMPYGNHKIKNKLETNVNSFLDLKSDISDMIINHHMWYYENFYSEVLT